MRPGTAIIKVVEDACNKVKNVLDSLGGESTYQNYVVNVSVGEDGEEKLCVMEYGARRTSWLKENIGWPEVVAYTGACTATTLACEALLKVGSFGTDAGVRAKDILMEILGCGIAPGFATTFIQLSQNPSPPPGLFSLVGGVGAGIASGISLYELPRLASVAQVAQGPIEVSGLGAVGGSLGGVALSATAGGIMYGATGVPWAGYVIAASPAYRLGLAARWLRDYRRVWRIVGQENPKLTEDYLRALTLANDERFFQMARRFSRNFTETRFPESIAEEFFKVDALKNLENKILTPS